MVDLGFSLDESSSVGSSNFDLTRDALSNALSRIPTSGDNTYRVAVTTFSSGTPTTVVAPTAVTPASIAGDPAGRLHDRLWRRGDRHRRRGDEPHFPVRELGRRVRRHDAVQHHHRWRLLDPRPGGGLHGGRGGGRRRDQLRGHRLRRRRDRPPHGRVPDADHRGDGRRHPRSDDERLRHPGRGLRVLRGGRSTPRCSRSSSTPAAGTTWAAATCRWSRSRPACRSSRSGSRASASCRGGAAADRRAPDGGSPAAPAAGDSTFRVSRGEIRMKVSVSSDPDPERGRDLLVGQAVMVRPAPPGGASSASPNIQTPQGDAPSQAARPELRQGRLLRRRDVRLRAQDDPDDVRGGPQGTAERQRGLRLLGRARARPWQRERRRDQHPASHRRPLPAGALRSGLHDTT